MNNTVRFGSFVLSCAIAGAVFAQGAPAPAPVSPAAGGVSASADFSSIDTNKDGKVSSTEAQSNTDLRSAFSSLDADKDTYLSQSEFAKWNKGKSGAMPAPGADRSTGGASSNSISEPAGASPKSSDSAPSSEQK